jgi:uncharacterized membrane protein YadS
LTEPEQSVPEQRRAQVRRGIIFLLLALVLLLLALLLFGNAQPEWNEDGSRDAFPDWVRALLAASVIAGTMLIPISARAFLLAALPSKVLALALGVFVGVIGAVAVPLELLFTLAMTSADEPGARERYESGSGGWDWD